MDSLQRSLRRPVLILAGYLLVWFIGTGYSSLSYLNRFPLDIVELDRSFVGSLSREGAPEGGSVDGRLISGIVDLAHSLDIRMVAEGVECAGQPEHLRRIGCDLVQGYYLSKPLTAEETSMLLGCSSITEPGGYEKV